MLTETYIEALLVDESSADQVWEAWDNKKAKRWCSADSLVDDCCAILAR